MRNFEVEERLVEGGAVLTVRALNGLVFENGETVMDIPLMADYGPMVGESVICDRKHVTVAQKRYDANHSIWVMDEDTGAWYQWRAR